MKKLIYKKLLLNKDGEIKMEKWADYVITEVRFKGDKIHIEEVKRREDAGDNLINERTMLREDVIRELENNIRFVTVYKKEGKWVKGDNVGIVKVNDKKFIRTDGNTIEEDNLGNLPTF